MSTIQRPEKFRSSTLRSRELRNHALSGQKYLLVKKSPYHSIPRGGENWDKHLPQSKSGATRMGEIRKFLFLKSEKRGMHDLLRSEIFLYIITWVRMSYLFRNRGVSEPCENILKVFCGAMIHVPAAFIIPIP